MENTTLNRDSILNLNWYHPNIDRHIAETLLKNNGEEGDFLLRSKTNGTQEEFVLCVRSKDAVQHFEVSIKDNQMCFGFGTFSSVEEFTEHFKSQPLVAGENGVLTVIRYPYPCRVDEPNLYQTVRIHASVGTNRSVREHQPLAVGSKEGFLTKRGSNVKNWKTRWFTMNKNDLKYYKNRYDKVPIKTIDLRECTGCQINNTMKKENCFTVELPWRTFYMYATTREEANEWLALLTWKVNSNKATQAEHQTP